MNLPSAPTRLHDAPVYDALEYQVPASTVMDVRDLALYQKRFSQAAVSDWTSQERYMQFMQDIFGAKGSNEVDKVPIRLKKGAQLSVMPRDLYATDGPSMGELMSINNFQVNHTWGDFIAPEHMIVCYIMLLRFAPVMEDGVAPAIYPSETNYAVYQGDADILGVGRPNSISSREIDGSGDGTAIGYLPSGWQHREGFNHVDFTVSNLSNFPLLDGQPQTAAGYRDASNINNNTFRSTALRHWFADLDFKCEVDSRVKPAGTSITVGLGARQPKGLHPTGGFLM